MIKLCRGDRMRIRGAVDAYAREQKAYAVAYLDILGITNRIKSSREAQLDALNTLHNLYTSIMELADPQKGIKKYEGIQFKIFSDNIIIAKPLSQEDPANDVAVLLSCVSNFLCSAVGAGVGWLVRGGITIGDFYLDDTIVWGPALLRAYELEDKIAIYPRIILDEIVTNVLSGSTIKNDFVRVDQDGLRFLNYMDIWHFSGQLVSAAFEHMKAEARRADGTYPDKVFQKLYWHMNYINAELDKKNEKQDRNYRLAL